VTIPAAPQRLCHETPAYKEFRAIRSPARPDLSRNSRSPPPLPAQLKFVDSAAA
jgi:hypothetical protein